MGRAEFAATLLVVVTAAAWLGVRGVERHAELRLSHRLGELRHAATSPLAYGKVVAATRRTLLGGAPAGSPLLVIRADSLPGPAERERLCALARGGAGLGAPAAAVRWVALTEDVPACARGVLAAAPAPGAVSALRGELRSARWVVVGADARVLHNARGVPTADEVRGTLALLAPPAPEPAR